MDWEKRKKTNKAQSPKKAAMLSFTTAYCNGALQNITGAFRLKVKYVESWRLGLQSESILPLCINAILMFSAGTGR